MEIGKGKKTFRRGEGELLKKKSSLKGQKTRWEKDKEGEDVDR